MTYKTLVTLLDKPSSESFGMTGILISSQEGVYETLGLTKNRSVTKREFEQLGGHILEVKSPLQQNLYNPVALWLGRDFYTKAIALKTPNLPATENWHQPLKPHQDRGKYAVKESAEAYRILEDWVIETATEALQTNNHGLAVLTGWTLPLHPATKAALYFTAIDKSKELDWQLRVNPGRKTANDLVREHETVRSKLLV